MSVLTQAQVSAGVGDINSRVKLDDGREGYIVGYLRDDSGAVDTCVVDVGRVVRDLVYLDCEVVA